MAYNPNNPNGQATSADSAPVVIASDQSTLPANITQVGNVAVAATSKGLQGTNFVPVQQPKDSGRTYVTFYIDAITGVTTEALVTMNINTAGTVTTGTSYSVPSGKTLRLTSYSVTIRATSTSAITGRIRVRSAATVAATSGIIFNADIPVVSNAGVVGEGVNVSYNVPDGVEIAATQQIGISQIISSTSSVVSAILIGFLY